MDFDAILEQMKHERLISPIATVDALKQKYNPQSTHLKVKRILSFSNMEFELEVFGFNQFSVRVPVDE